ncbi:MAG TPA: hypothetical protein ENH10_02830, partial [Bacteroidetes bacterium]|nr:hypothetical protein [Bacteroidota bacterium]HEX04075.1 hypothetical protein [Bacteroidota bacterium]
MKRGLVVVFRVIPLLLLLGGITFLMLPRSMEIAVNDIDSRYLPSRASLQFHAERLANHFQHRLMTPPLQILPDSLTQPVDSLLYPDFGLPPRLESADFPQRYPVSWTKSDGWITPPPVAKEKSLIRMFNRLAKRTTWTAPTMTILFMDPPEKEGAMVLAGTWVYASDNSAFEGVLTPVAAYYDYYLPRWFDEYCTITFGRILESWVWRPAEFRLIPHDMERAPIIFHESQPLD